jgi:anti-anti-sigma factor
MSCEIKSTVRSGEVVIDVAGRLSFLDFSLRERIEKLVKEGHREFVLDLSNLSYLDSFGLGQLVCARNSVERAGGQIKLLRPPEHAQKLLQITKLNTVFTTVNEEESRTVGAV